MPSRNFCDRCGKEILKDESVYTIETNTTKEDSYGGYPPNAQIYFNGKRITPIHNMDMVCRGCMTQLLELLLTKPDVGA